MDDLIIVGAGWAGLAAAAFALDHGAKIRLIAQGIGSLIVTPGWISIWESAGDNLLGALGDLIERIPDHPYALAGLEALLQAVHAFSSLSNALNLDYLWDTPLHNYAVRTVLGGIQHPALVPAAYVNPDDDGAPLYIGFEGWRDYYPMLSGARTAMIPPPIQDRPWDATPTDLARAFDMPGVRATTAAQVKPLLKSATSVYFPAVLGLDHHLEACEDLRSRLGVPILEMPTLPPSVPGTRLFNRLRRYLLDQGVRVQIGHPVARGIITDGRITGVEVAAAGKPQRFQAKAVILATGGLYGGGLFSDDRGQIWEPIFGLPVSYDPDRTRWFNPDLLDPRGHPVHYFGIRVNDQMQPVDVHGAPVIQGLYAAGQLLAHPQADGAPLPSECAEGVALVTAYKAVTSALAR